MTDSIREFCNRIGCISDKSKVESGYSFDNEGESLDGVKITYHEGDREVKWESNEKVYREKRNARRRELYQNYREEHPTEFEAKQSKKREKYKNKGEMK